MFVARRDKTDNLYTRLQKSSLEMLEQLCGGQWTDFNPHDPGVTMLDALNYALTELDYQLGFALEEHLGSAQQGAVDMRRFGVWSTEELFGDSVVVPADYERLIGGCVAGVEACRVSVDERGRYRIAVEASPGADRSAVVRQIEALYHAHRNLCETLGPVVFERVAPRTQKSPDERPVVRAGAHGLACSGVAPGAYRSVQLDFPNCYGLNQQGIPPYATDQHVGRIRQLKGYLLVFDYLLANAYAQGAGTAKMLDVSTETPSYKLPAIDIPHLGDLIDRERIAQVRIDNQAFRRKQKSGYLNALDALYGEDTSSLADNLLRAQLIRQLPKLNAERFLSFNLLDPNPGSTTGLKRLVSALSGLPTNEEQPLTNILARHSLKLLKDDHFFGHVGHMPNMEFVFAEAHYNWDSSCIEAVAHQEVTYNERSVLKLRRQMLLLRHGVLFESFLHYGPDPCCYRLVRIEPQGECLLVFKHPQMERWINLGSFLSEQELVEAANVLWHFMARLSAECASFYLVEHLLLGPNNEPHTLSVVLPLRIRTLMDVDRYEQTIAERLPAHLDVRFRWLHADTLHTFECLYYPWKKALSDRDAAAAEQWAGKITNFLADAPQDPNDRQDHL